MNQAIYVIRSEPGPVKVGIAINPEARRTLLQTGAAARLFLDFAARPNGNAQQLEAHTHLLLSEHRATGEWFNLPSQEAIGAIMRAASDLDMALEELPKQERVRTMSSGDYNDTRSRLGLTHKALAELLGIEHQTSRVYGAGKRPTETITNLLKLIEALGVAEARRILEKRK